MVDNNRLQAEINALDAYLEAIGGNPDVALQKLGRSTDPVAVFRHLGILIDAERFLEARQVINDLPPHEEWCHLAIVAALASGASDLSRSLLSWANAHLKGHQRDRCRLLYAEWLTRTSLDANRSQPLSSRTLNTDQRNALRSAIEAIQPTLDVVVARDTINSNLELISLERAIKNLILLADRAACPGLCRIVEQAEPIPIVAAEFAIARTYPPAPNIAARLRNDHPASFDANCLACAIEADVLSQPHVALTNALVIVDMADSESRREQLAALIADILQHLPANGDKAAEAAINVLLTTSPKKALFEARRHLLAGQIDDAQTLLDKATREDDPLWLQLAAQIASARNDTTTAITRLRQAADLTGQPELFRTLAHVAFAAGDLDQCKAALSALIEFDPNDYPARANAARLAIQQRNFVEAERHLTLLHAAKPDNDEHALNLAACRARLGDSAGCLKLYEQLCGRCAAPIDAVIGRSEIQKSLGEPRLAFQSLHGFRNSFWDHPRFVQAYLSMAWAAGEDDKGNEALIHLRRLQFEGKAPPEVLESKTLDELLDHAKEYNERRDTFARQLLVGRMPWVLADWLLNHTTYDGWHIRSQQLPWVFDEPLNIAMLSIYSSNAFALARDDSDNSLIRLESSPRNKPVVADISSLVILNELELLGPVAEYCGQILYPSDYLGLFLPEASRLVLHQPSYEHELKHVKRLIDTHEIVVINDIGTAGNRPFAYVNEHSGIGDDVEHYYRLGDVFHVLEQDGQLGEQAKGRIAHIQLRPSAVDTGHPPLNHGDTVLIALSTLHSLAAHGFLDSVTHALRLRLSSAEYDDIVASLEHYDAQRERHEAHERLWTTVRDDSRYSPRPHTPMDSFGEHDRFDLSIASASLARQHTLPLLADDRAVQMLALNTSQASNGAAFGIVDLLPQLETVGLITRAQLVNAMLRLMRWRVRFIVPPSRVLLALAIDARSNPPGESLRQVARYMHDCIRDPGLFGGFEPTTPPLSMAFRLVQEWARTAATLIIDMWRSAELSDEQCIALTEWVTLEMTPGLPPSTAQASAPAAEAPRCSVLANVLIRGIDITDERRAHLAVSTVRQGLGFTKAEYRKLLCEVLRER